MKNTQKGFGIIIVLAVVAVIAIGGGVYYSAKKALPVETKVVEVEKNINIVATSSVKGTFRSLFDLNEDVICTLRSSNSKGESSGTVYVSGQMMRGDFTIPFEGGAQGGVGGTMDSHMLRNGENIYVWSGNQGAKMGMSMIENNNAVASQGGINLDQNVDYKCSPWAKDSSKFETPSNINFVDIEAMLKIQGRQ